jgi:hypothetical protein
MRAMSSGFVTSALTATCLSSAPSFSTPAPSWSASTSRAPSLARRRAVAAPMPRAAPVISTVRPLIDPIMAPLCATFPGEPHTYRNAGNNARRARPLERGSRARYGTRSSFRNSSSSGLGTSARSRTRA